jgi:hypothetical protein
MEDQIKKQMIFKKELEKLINRFSLENCSNTPDFILAEYLLDCLNNFNEVTKKREKWYSKGDTKDTCCGLEIKLDNK